MWLLQGSLQELQSLIWGYYTALGVHGIVEDVPQMDHHFTLWLLYRTEWSTCCGWAEAIKQRHKDPKKAFAAFFAFVDEFQKLRPTVVATVKLTARHNPTGKRCKIGLDGLMDRPDRIDIVRYRPEPLHFLRFHYKDRVENQWLLMTGNGEYATTVRYAKQWVRDELQVEYDAWKRVK